MSTEESDHLLLLPSNAGSKIFQNKANNFIVNLVKPLNLRGEWEVALREITYPVTFPNLTFTSDIYFFFKRPIGDIQTNKPIDKIENDKASLAALNLIKDWKKDEELDVVKVTLYRGYYEDEQKLLDAIHSQFEIEYLKYNSVRQGDYPLPQIKLYYNPYAQKINLNLGKDEAYIFLTDLRLAKLMGIHPSLSHVVATAPKDSKSKSVNVKLDYFTSPIQTNVKDIPTLRNQLPSLYVYSDCISPIQVGDVYCNLLRAVHISGQQNTYAHHEWLKPYYMPVASQYINAIKVWICDDAGEPVNFITGKVNLMLHFRRRDTTTTHQ